jgi:hypothetical protein
MANPRRISEPGGDLIAELAHFRFAMPAVRGKAQLAHGRAHEPGLVPDRYRFQHRIVQHGQVARLPCQAGPAQRGERLGYPRHT